MKRFIVLLKVLVAAIAVFTVSSALADPPEYKTGWHHGELKWLDIGLEYSGYLFIDADGLPVYLQGSGVLYNIKVKNEGMRTFKNYQIRRSVRYAKDHYDAGGILLARKGELLPGDSVSAWRDLELTSKEVLDPPIIGFYSIPFVGIGLVWVYMTLEMRHFNYGLPAATAMFHLYPPIRIIQ